MTEIVTILSIAFMCSAIIINLMPKAVLEEIA